jgi:hypothetical protein
MNQLRLRILANSTLVDYCMIHQPTDPPLLSFAIVNLGISMNNPYDH